MRTWAYAVSLLAAVAASSLQHPEDTLASLTIVREHSGVSVCASALADSAAYVLFVSVVHSDSSTLLLDRSWRNLTVPPGDSTAVRQLILPAHTASKIRVEAELQDMFPGLSEDDALLARINMMVELRDENPGAETQQNGPSGAASIAALNMWDVGMFSNNTFVNRGGMADEEGGNGQEAEGRRAGTLREEEDESLFNPSKRPGQRGGGGGVDTETEMGWEGISLTLMLRTCSSATCALTYERGQTSQSVSTVWCLVTP